MEELNTVKAELDTLKQAQADAERTRKQEEMKSFASANGLDVEAEAIAKVIDSLDYEALIAAAMENKDPTHKAAAARPMSDIAVGDPYGGILGKTNQ